MKNLPFIIVLIAWAIFIYLGFVIHDLPNRDGEYSNPRVEQTMDAAKRMIAERAVVHKMTLVPGVEE